MNFKNYAVLGVLTFVINLLSIYNAVFAVWSLIMVIFAWFIINNRDASGKTAKDKKSLGAVQAFMLAVFIFIGLVMGGTGIFTLNYVVVNYVSSFIILFIILAVAGLIIYAYFAIRLLLETISVIQGKGHAL